VHHLAPIEAWSKRFDQINAFERTLAEEGTTILKFFLNISKDEQRKRLQERRDDSTKQWKFNPGDLKERELWGQYMEAYEEVLSRTSTDWAPWYIVPANHKWYRNLVIGRVLVTTLQSLNMKYPRPIEDFSQIQIT
jgi:polyphosphate kinase 2 (PPK2 family)